MSVIAGIYFFLSAVLTFFWWAVILAAVFSMLSSFGIIDTRNRIVWQIGDFLYRVTEPLLRPVRKVLPSFGNIDLSPLVLLLAIQFVARPVLFTVFRGVQDGYWSLT